MIKKIIFVIHILLSSTGVLKMHLFSPYILNRFGILFDIKSFSFFAYTTKLYF